MRNNRYYLALLLAILFYPLFSFATKGLIKARIVAIECNYFYDESLQQKVGYPPLKIMYDIEIENLSKCNITIPLRTEYNLGKVFSKIVGVKDGDVFEGYALVP